MTVVELRELLGWCSAINIGLLVLAAFFLVVARNWVLGMHSRMFGLSEEDLSRAYFQYLAQFKIVVLVFNLVPYIALRIMA